MLGNSGNHYSHLRNGLVHDPSGTGETDSRSGEFSYENQTRFHARLGCDPVDWEQQGGSLCVFLDQCWFAACDLSSKDEVTCQRFKGCVKRLESGMIPLCACDVHGFTKSPSKRALNCDANVQCVFIIRQILG